jgi:hypothetical protein
VADALPRVDAGAVASTNEPERLSIFRPRLFGANSCGSENCPVRSRLYLPTSLLPCARSFNARTESRMVVQRKAALAADAAQVNTVSFAEAFSLLERAGDQIRRMARDPKYAIGRGMPQFIVDRILGLACVETEHRGVETRALVRWTSATDRARATARKEGRRQPVAVAPAVAPAYQHDNDQTVDYSDFCWNQYIALDQLAPASPAVVRFFLRRGILLDDEDVERALMAKGIDAEGEDNGKTAASPLLASSAAACRCALGRLCRSCEGVQPNPARRRRRRSNGSPRGPLRYRFRTRPRPNDRMARRWPNGGLTQRCERQNALETGVSFAAAQPSRTGASARVGELIGRRRVQSDGPYFH